MDRETPRPYALPRDVQERLTVALKRFRNREAAHTLAVFLARFWSAPNRLTMPFHIDRRALSENETLLGLTEKQIRGAIRTLEAIGFLDRAIASGSLFKATPDGLRKKPIRFHFGGEYGVLFDRANRRAAARRKRQAEAVRPQVAINHRRACTASAEAQNSKGPKNRNPSLEVVHMGPVVKGSGFPAQASEPNANLEAALARFEEGFRQSRGG